MASRSTTRTHRTASRKRRPAAGRAAKPSLNGSSGAEIVRSFERTYPKDRERKDLYPFTLSGLPIKPLYGPGDLAGIDYGRDIGVPGEYPYTRGIHPTMYRGRMFTMRQFSGFGTPKESNERYHYLLEHGQTGLSIAFDNPTIMGYDSDHPKAHGEVGKCGVAVDSLRDMEILLDGIDPGAISTSMTINGPASILFGFYLANAEKRGVPFDRLRGTLQNDILKEYIAQKCWCYPPEPSLRIIVDQIEFATRHVPQWNTISISGYHIREAGSTAAQELAFTLADGFTYVEACLKRGLDIDAFAPRLSFFWNSHLDFFEEIAKLRAARRIWARHMRERYQAKRKESWLMRFHTQTAGCSLWDKQPENNIVRTAYQALAAVLGGTQSLHTNSMDETIALPSDKAVKIALRTQQIVAHEIGVTETADPLAGSYYLESLTNRLEAEAENYFRQIEGMGGVVAGIEKGFFQREIARAAYQYQQEMERKQRVLVGINEYVEPDEKIDIPILYISEQAEVDQKAGLEELRRTRDNKATTSALKALTAAAASAPGEKNVMAHIFEAARVYATEGEIRGAIREVYGDYVESTEFSRTGVATFALGSPALPIAAPLGPVGWYHLAMFGLVMPYAAIKSRARLAALTQRPSLTAWLIRSAVLVVVAGALSLVTANLAGISLGQLAFPRPLHLFLGLVLLAAFVAVMRPVWRKAVAERSPGAYYKMPLTGRDRGLWIGVSIAAGVCEEITWRGVQTALLAALLGNPWLAALLSALMFAVAHAIQSVRAMVFIFVFSFIMSVLVAITGSLILPMLIHAAYDAIAGFSYARFGRELGYEPPPLPGGATDAPDERVVG